MMKKPPLIILTGPTAVGKTKLSIALAKAVGGEIISADSMQVYKEMDIGSAKIRKEEMNGIPHFLVDVLSPSEEFHVVKFQEMAKEALKGIYKRGHIPIVVGGTGFYIQALLYDIDFTKGNEDTSYRDKLEALAKEKGCVAVHAMLKEVDEKAAMEIHPNNLKRVIRALEFHHQTGGKISEHNEKERQKESPYQFLYLVLHDERAKLYARIESRIDEMIDEGLLEEVRALKEKGYTKDMVSMQGLGYKEILSYLDNEISFEEAVYILKRDTRHFAKRQITWFKRERDVTWIEKGAFDYDEKRILDYILELLEKRGILGYASDRKDV